MAHEEYTVEELVRLFITDREACEHTINIILSDGVSTPSDGHLTSFKRMAAYIVRNKDDMTAFNPKVFNILFLTEEVAIC